MTSYELLEFYEEVLSKMEKLSAYTDELSELIMGIDKNKDPLLNLIYAEGLNSSNSNYINNFTTYRNGIINSMQDFAMKFDTLENHTKLIRVRDEIKVIFDKYSLDLDEEKNKVNNILDEYNAVTTTIYQYVKTKSSTVIVDLLNKISLVVNDYDKFIQNYRGIKYFINKTENKVEEKEHEEILKLQFYDEHLDPEYFIKNIQAIRDSYETMCQVFKISSSENELKVLKIESGSLLVKIIGDTSIISTVAFLIKKITELVFNKYTLEGKILRHKQILDLLREDAEVIAKYKELGLNISFDEDITKYHYQLVKSIGKLVGQTTKMKINNEELSLEGHFKQQYLSESKVLLIEDPSNQKDAEDFSSEEN